MVWKYGKRKWENINKIGTLENVKYMLLQNIRKTGSMRNMKNRNFDDIRKNGSMGKFGK